MEIPVGAGRATPLEGNNAIPDPWREVSDGFWGMTLPQATAATEPVPAAELIAGTVSRSTQPVVLFVSGTHTNLAEALRLDPDIAGQIRDVYIMGGSLYQPGNIKSDWPEIDNSTAEWNIWADPLAAHEVFASGLPLHLVPLDATNRVTWTQADAPGWAASGSAEGALAGDLLEWMLSAWSAREVYIWDLVAAVSTTDPALCPETPLSVEVVIAPGPEQGRTAVVDGAPNVGACLAPDAAQIKARVAGVLGR